MILEVYLRPEGSKGYHVYYQIEGQTPVLLEKFEVNPAEIGPDPLERRVLMAKRKDEAIGFIRGFKAGCRISANLIEGVANRL